VRDAVIIRAKNETPNSSAKSDWEKYASWVATDADIFYRSIKAACCCPRFRLMPLLHRFQRTASQNGVQGAAPCQTKSRLSRARCTGSELFTESFRLERMIEVRIAGCTCVGCRFGEPTRFLIRRLKVSRAPSFVRAAHRCSCTGEII
jgi:hypothetical protein